MGQQGKQITAASSLHAALAEKAFRASAYFSLRADFPEAPARHVFRYVAAGPDSGENGFEQALCGLSRGHEFACTGTAYGGSDESYHGEGRCYCVHCGADGDA